MTQNSHPASHTVDLPDDVVLSVRNVSKKFCRNLRRSMGYGIKDLARNLVGLSAFESQPSALRKDEFWALKDISFDLKRGEALGLIGDNGCGKTTMLRLITGIFPPDEGLMATRGRVGALIALGAGFHPHLTGRDNVFLNGAILGLTREEIVDQFEAITQFAEIGEFLDAPVSTYSSGMRVRLGFAIAVHVNPSLLLVDEILAVGDASFQTKCMEKMDEIRSSDKAVILVTHSLYRIESLCDRALWMDHGGMVKEGDARFVVNAYLEKQDALMLESKKRAPNKARVVDPSDDWVRILSVEVINAKGESVDALPFGAPMKIRAKYNAARKLRLPVFAMRFHNRGQGVLDVSMMVDGHGPEFIEGEGTVECDLGRVPLTPKVYDLYFQVRNANAGVYVSPWVPMKTFRVSADGLEQLKLSGPMANSTVRAGAFYWPRTWSFFKNGSLTHTINSKRIEDVQDVDMQ
jgi:lipopolysaccharide transport system ATP-binding protein